MIIADTVSSPVATNVGAAPSKFKIKASAKAFKILSGFYSDPVLAIPRELGANAWDSHVSAGKTDKMFEVHAPNTLEPWFSIRDFGTGLSAEAIDQIYTTYFESTKTGDNDSDGCMGLGSKTPFNYTENFSVTSWFNGKKFVYNCFIDERGSPNILPFGVENSTEPNGVEVKFAVKSADISTFVDKIRQAYAPFRYKPTITGATITYPTIKYTFKGTDWAIREYENGYSYGAKSFAFMGNYSYPINVDALFSSDARYNNDKVYTKVSHILQYASTELYFNIGDLEVAPNKEQLQYDADEKTQKAIIAAAVKAYDELLELVQKSIDKPTSIWNAMELYAKYNSYDSKYYNFNRIIGSIPIRYNKKDISSKDVRSDDVHEESGLNKGVVTDPRDSRKQFADKYGHFAVEQYEYRLSNGQLRKRYTNTYTAGGPSGSLFFYTNDTKFRRARVRHYLTTNYSGKNFPTIHIIFDHSKKGEVFEAHRKYLGLDNAQVLHIESLPKPPRTPRNPSTAKTDEIPEFILDSNYWSRNSFTAEAKGTYYYIDFIYSAAYYKTNQIGFDTVSGILSYGVKEKILSKTKTRIFGINKRNAYMLKTGTWINVLDLVLDHAKKNKESLEHQLYLQDTYQPLCQSHNNLRYKIQRSSFTTKLDNKDTKKLFESFDNAFATQNTDSVLVGVARFMGLKGKKLSTFDDSLLDTVKTIQTKYMGLFDMVDTYSIDTTKFAKIVNFIDKNS
jgi:hypothetical protein